MSLSTRFVVRSAALLLAVGFLTLVGIVGTTIWLGERAQVYFREVIAARDTRATAVELRNAMLTAESSQRGFISTGNEIYLAPYASAKALTLSLLDSLGQSISDYPASDVILPRLTAVTSEKISEMDRSIGLKNARRDDEALALLRTNRGKALMDEANVFMSGIIQAADDRLTAGVAEQRANARMLRWVSIVGGIVIVLVAGVVTATVLRYAREIVAARDEVRALNAGLEKRVQDRTAALERARDRAEVLLDEVNHRVANSLALVASLTRLQANALTDRSAKAALGAMQARIHAIASVHKRLYSAGDARSVALDEYLAGLLDQFADSMRAEGSGTSLRYDLEPLKLSTDASINLGVVVTELVTNAFKYAYPGEPGEVRVRVKRLSDGRVELVVEDDGVGRGETGVAKGTGLGTRIVTAMATTMGAEMNYLARQPGTAAQLIFPVPAFD